MGMTRVNDDMMSIFNTRTNRKKCNQSIKTGKVKRTPGPMNKDKTRIRGEDIKGKKGGENIPHNNRSAI